MSKSTKAATPAIRPLGEKVLIERLAPEGTSPGGIVLPDTAKEQPQKGTVLVLGDGKLMDDGSLATFAFCVGDLVLFAPYAGMEVEVDGKKYLLMNGSEIFAVLE